MSRVYSSPGARSAASGRHPGTRILDQASYQRALLAKLTEEAHEAGRAAAGLPSELADVLEVLRALTSTAGVSRAQLLARRRQAQSPRGFGTRILPESVD